MKTALGDEACGVISGSSTMRPWSWSETVSVSLGLIVSVPGVLVYMGFTGLVFAELGASARPQGIRKTKGSTDVGRGTLRKGKDRK